MTPLNLVKIQVVFRNFFSFKRSRVVFFTHFHKQNQIQLSLY
jgi:hypothetical protein